VIPASVRYHRAASLDDAIGALAEPEARALAGGQSLLAVMKLRIAQPSVVVDIGRLDLRGIEPSDGELRIGALTTWDELAEDEALERPALAALAECASVIGDLQVRNRGTVGGSLAHADPASDMPAVLLALGATLALRSAAGDRVVSLANFFLGPFTTALEPGELITEVVVPLAPSGSGSAYAKVEHPASGFALAGAAAFVQADGARKIALTGVGATPLLVGNGDQGALAAAEIYGDGFAPADYRRHLAGVLVARALARAQQRMDQK
jgi:aerobic carbon-monoxide dehydrogenase medium subunit